MCYEFFPTYWFKKNLDGIHDWTNVRLNQLRCLLWDFPFSQSGFTRKLESVSNSFFLSKPLVSLLFTVHTKHLCKLFLSFIFPIVVPSPHSFLIQSISELWLAASSRTISCSAKLFYALWWISGLVEWLFWDFY